MDRDRASRILDDFSKNFKVSPLFKAVTVTLPYTAEQAKNYKDRTGKSYAGATIGSMIETSSFKKIYVVFPERINAVKSSSASISALDLSNSKSDSYRVASAINKVKSGKVSDVLDRIAKDYGFDGKDRVAKAAQKMSNAYAVFDLDRRIVVSKFNRASSIDSPEDVFYVDMAAPIMKKGGNILTYNNYAAFRTAIEAENKLRTMLNNKQRDRANFMTKEENLFLIDSVIDSVRQFKEAGGASKKARKGKATATSHWQKFLERYNKLHEKNMEIIQAVAKNEKVNEYKALKKILRGDAKAKLLQGGLKVYNITYEGKFKKGKFRDLQSVKGSTTNFPKSTFNKKNELSTFGCPWSKDANSTIFIAVSQTPKKQGKKSKTDVYDPNKANDIFNATLDAMAASLKDPAERRFLGSYANAWSKGFIAEMKKCRREHIGTDHESSDEDEETSGGEDEETSGGEDVSSADDDNADTQLDS